MFVRTVAGALYLVGRHRMSQGTTFSLSLSTTCEDGRHGVIEQQE